MSIIENIWLKGIGPKNQENIIYYHTQWNWRETDSWELPLPKAPKLDWSIERPADLKLTFNQCSNRGNYATLGWGDDVRSRQLAQDADLTFMIIYNVFLIPWTYAY